MTRLYDQYDLPPPPRPLVLSRHDPSRMLLPDFTDAEEVKAFCDRLFIYRQPLAVNVANIAMACCTIVLLCGCVAREVQLYAQKRQWLFRFVKTSRGTFLIPAINSVYSVFTCLYLLLNSICAIIILAAFHRNRPVVHIPAWLLLQTTPFLWAVSWQIWAVCHDRIPGSKRFELCNKPSHRQVQLSASLVNTFWLVLPAAETMFVSIPAIIADVRYQHKLQLYYRWRQQYGDATEISRDMLLDLMQIWTRGRMVVLYMSVTCFFWFGLVMVLATAYAIVNFRLIVKLRQHLSALLRLKQAREAVRAVRLEMTTVVVVESDDPVRIRSPFAQLSGAAQSSAYSPPWTETRQKDSQDSQSSESLTSSFFPNVAPGSAKHEPLGDGSEYRRALFLFPRQSFALTTGCVLFCIFALTMGLLMVPAEERNKMAPLEAAHVILTQLLAAGLGILVIVRYLYWENCDVLALMRGDIQDDQLGSVDETTLGNGGDGYTADLPLKNLPVEQER
ncbi:hypothetical protein V8E36_002450 [Tilletia maclaganii]